MAVDDKKKGPKMPHRLLRQKMAAKKPRRESILHQACKTLVKVAKLTKAFIIQKHSRKLTDLRKSSNSNPDKDKEIEALVKEIQAVKEVDHIQAGNHLCKQHFDYCEQDAAQDAQALKALIKHKRMIKEVESWKNKLNEFDDKQKKDLEAQMLKQEQSNKGKKFKNIIKGISMANGERTKAIFLDTLNEDSEDEDSDEIEENGTKRIKNQFQDLKRLRKEQQKTQQLIREKESLIKDANRDKSGQDLSMYMPSELRPMIKKSKKQEKAESESVPNDGNRTENSFEKSNNKQFNDKFHNKNNHNNYQTNTHSNYNNNNNMKKRSFDDSFNREAKKSVVNEKEAIVDGKDWKQNGLHPSWAAKKLAKQTPTLEAFAGKKIVFSDDD